MVATIGDRLGFRVGKARLSILGLRPKYTATVATFITGLIVSAVTMGLILAVSEQVRIGFFSLDRLLAELQDARNQKEATQEELQAAQQLRTKAEDQLHLTNQQLQGAQKRQQVAGAKLKTLEKQVVEVRQRSLALEAEATQAQKKLAQAQAQVASLQTEEARLMGRQRTLQASNQKLQRTLEVKRSEVTALKTLQTELLAALDRQTAQADLSGIALRKGNFILQAEDVISTGIIAAGLSRQRQQEALDRLFASAEMEVRRRGAAPDPRVEPDRALVIPRELVTQILANLSLDKDSIVQILAAQNSLRGEAVPVIASVQPNTVLFASGEVVASQEMTLPQSEEALVHQLDQLFQQAGKHARNRGILTTENGQVGAFSEEALTRLKQDLRKYQGAVTLQAVTSETIYRRGPLNLKLVALQNGRVLTRTL